MELIDPIMRQLSTTDHREALYYLVHHYGCLYDISSPTSSKGWIAVHRESGQVLTAENAPLLLQELRRDAAVRSRRRLGAED